jgi:chloramphenicol 3-O phosphotransferase
MAGTILLLNGTSTAGKTSLARAVQDQSPAPFLHVGIDAFYHHLVAAPYRRGVRAAEGFAFVPVPETDPPELAMVCGPYGQQVVSALHHTVALFSRLGHHVVVDHHLHERGWLRECVHLWQDLPVVFVGVHCPLEVVAVRAMRRTDSTVGELRLYYARWRLPRVHAHGMYDLEVNTAQHSPAECAATLLDYLKAGPSPTAFVRLAEQLPRSPSAP